MCCVLSEDMSFETFSPICSHINENETKIVKKNIQKNKILKNKMINMTNIPGDMINRYLSPSFDVNLLAGIREDRENLHVCSNFELSVLFG